jgi:hypothetical protein
VTFRGSPEQIRENVPSLDLHRTSPLAWTEAVLAILLICALTLGPGCTTRSAYIVARKGTQCQVAAAGKIAIADQAHPRPEESALREALLAELRQMGFALVAPAQADYSLIYWIDEAWKPGTKVVANREGCWNDLGLEPGPLFFWSVPPYFVPRGYLYLDQPSSMQRVLDAPYAVKGIHLKLFSQESIRAGRFDTAWDGYIEMGSYVRERREPILLRTLLAYLGTDFIGRARLVR